jgi:hypothetical protein
MHRYVFLALLVLSLALASSARAGQITNLQLYDGTSGAPTASISYTNANGTGSNSAYVYADPQVSFGTTTPMYYCVDLWHDNYLGSTYTITPVPTMSFGTSSFSDVDNRIGWLLTQDQSTPESRAAVQLALWYTVDNKPGPGASGFSMSTGDSTITSDYNQLTSFAGYNAKTVYSADFWQATHDSGNTLYQDLVSAAPGPAFQTNSVPEPGSIVLGSIGLVVLAAVRWLRRAG